MTGTACWCGFGLLLAMLAMPISAPAREITITDDSMRGWVPSEALERKARKTYADFEANLDAGRNELAYDRLQDDLKTGTSFARFV